MKIRDLLNEDFNDSARSAVKAARDLGQRSRDMELSGRLTDKHFELAFNAVKNQELEKEEIADLSRELADTEQYGRSKDSANFILNRMHILVHGVAPGGETERRAETMFGIPKTMIDFANRKGIDTDYNIEHAREELRNRPSRIKRPEAMKIMSDYYMANKATLPKSVKGQREEIIGRLMQGMAPEQAFDVA